jgi:O-antigen/teichoic acid export membrane protein
VTHRAAKTARQLVDQGLAVARTWAQDLLLRRVLRNSTYLFISNVISAVLSIVTANLLGVAGFGVLGIVTSFVANVNRLFSFRMGDVVVRYVGAYLAVPDVAGEQKQRAAALIKAAGLLETITSLAAFVVLVLLAPLGARLIAKDETMAWMFVLYGLSILANFATETATGVLQVTNHFRSQAILNVVQSVVAALLIVWAAVTHAGLLGVLWAYLIGKILLGLGPIVLALQALPKALGSNWWRAPFSLLPPLRQLAGFAISTNLSGTINVVARDSEVLWVGFFFSPLEAGYFKTALAVVNLAIMPINPFIGATYPEITRCVAERQFARLRRLLRRVSLIAGTWTASVMIGLALFGRAVLFEPWIFAGRTFQVYETAFSPALELTLLLLIGFGTANTLFWNRPLLLAQNRAGVALRVAFYSMMGKVLLMVWLVPSWGYRMEAVLMTAYFVLSVGMMVWLGLREVRREERLLQEGIG